MQPLTLQRGPRFGCGADTGQRANLQQIPWSLCLTSLNIGSPEGVVMMQGPGEQSGQHRQQQAPLQCLGRMEDDLR